MRSRTTISLNCGVFQQATKRAEKLGYESFSQYVAYLLERDLKEREDHVVVREESPDYRKHERSKRRTPNVERPTSNDGKEK